MYKNSQKLFTHQNKQKQQFGGNTETPDKYRLLQTPLKTLAMTFGCSTPSNVINTLRRLSEPTHMEQNNAEASEFPLPGQKRNLLMYSTKYITKYGAVMEKAL